MSLDIIIKIKSKPRAITWAIVIEKLVFGTPMNQSIIKINYFRLSLNFLHVCP